MFIEDAIHESSKNSKFTGLLIVQHSEFTQFISGTARLLELSLRHSMLWSLWHNKFTQSIWHRKLTNLQHSKYTELTAQWIY